MGKKTHVVVCLFLTLIISQPGSYAQRTALGANILSGSVHWSQLNLSSAGCELMYGQYIIPGYWFGAMSATNRIEIDRIHSENINYLRYQAYGGYMQRLYGSRERKINIYGGGDIFIGAEFMDLFKTLTDPTRKGLYSNGMVDTKFIYGVSPRIEAEFYVFDAWAMTARFRLPLCFNSQFDLVGYEAGVGIRWAF